MKKINFLLWAVIFVFLSAEVFAIAEDVSCFQYYKYPGVSFELYPEKVVYSPDENVRLNYKIKNEFGSPLVEGNIFAIVLYRGIADVDRTEGDDILDEFYVEKNINIDKEKTYSNYFEWKIPKEAKPGVYVVNLYFTVKEKFSIAGLTFHTEIPGATTTFKVENKGNYKDILLEKNSTLINDKKYLFRAYIPAFSIGEEIKIKTKLLSEGLDNAKVKYELYSWSDASEQDKIEKFTKEETLTLEKTPKTLEYSLKDLPVGVYVTKITTTSQDLKSILRVRFVIKGTKGKIIFAGLDHFPLMKGDTTTAFLCIENSAAYPGEVDVNFTGKGNIKIIADDGTEIAKETFGPEEITPQIKGKKFSFMAPLDLTKVKVKTDFYDDKGTLMDSAEIVYDYSKFLGIEKTLKLTTMKDGTETTNFALGDSISYKIIYEDKFNDPLSGEVVLYLEDKDGKVLMMEEKTINGLLEGAISLTNLEEGIYNLKVIEKDEKLKDMKEIKVMKLAVPTVRETTTTIAITEEKGLSFPQLLLWILVIVGIVLVLTKFLWKKEK